MSKFSLTPKNVYQLLKVTAQVENINPQSDPKYILSAFSDFKGAIFKIQLNNKQVTSFQPSRLANDEFIFLLVPNGDMIECGHVCKDSPELREGDILIGSKDGTKGFIMFCGSYIKYGGKFDLDIIFSVPQGIEDVRLLILGSEPVPINIHKN
ncbi:MAG: hypothetical protein NT106_09195 [Candidatus Sumerlaeota bacterium]|nr:hypothetical protein [Candidatus Sumerlaeota bacterium]